MNQAERAHLTTAHCGDDVADWDAYLIRPLAERAADQDKIDAAFQQRGVQATRDSTRSTNECARCRLNVRIFYT